MRNQIEILRKDGIKENITLKNLDLTYMDKIMELQEIILNQLNNKELYAPTDKNEFISYIKDNGKIIGYVTKEDVLIAMGVYVKKGYNKENYGYDIGLKGDELLKVGQIESTVVKEEYRGNNLQRKICEELELIGIEDKVSILCATASPYNKFSVENFKKLGYKIIQEKIKYGGLKRYILMKYIDINL